MSIERFKLDHAQFEAVTFVDRPLLVDAGPGAGKTRILIARTAYLIEELGISPNGIYLATFTRKARAEMQERLDDVLAPGIADHVNVMTIDATAYRILKAVERIRETEVSKEFRVGDKDELYSHFKQAADLIEFHPDIMSTRDAWKLMKSWQARGRKNEGIPPELKSLFDQYEEQILQSRLWDVSDLVPKAMEALSIHPEIHSAFNVQAFLLDEYQDTTIMQFELIKMLIGSCRNFFTVGAPSQSIYGFRFADPTAFVEELDFHFGDMATTSLKYCYRSAEPILRAAVSLVPDSSDASVMEAVRKTGAIYLQELNNVVAEANFVATTIHKLLAANPKLRLKNIAVLSRLWSDTHDIENALGKAKIPYQIAQEGRDRFWETPEIVAMIGYLRAIQSIRDAEGARPNLDGALDMVLNYPPRGIGPTSHRIMLDGEAEVDWDHLIKAMNSSNLRAQVRSELKKLFEILVRLANSEIDKPVDMITGVLEQTKWLEAIAEELSFHTTRRLFEEKLMNATAEYSSIPELLAFAYKQLKGNWNFDGVHISSVHAAKGLEWKVVFVVGFNEGSFPASQASGPKAIAEEARVAHVATSRAMDLLFCTWPRTREINNHKKPVKPSRFLAGIRPYGKIYEDKSFVYPGAGNGEGVPGGNPFRFNEEDHVTFFG
ncbi:ATP-dependent helicase [bacterium]|nr:ATP-dependent helicase [bacterium]